MKLPDPLAGEREVRREARPFRDPGQDGDAHAVLQHGQDLRAVHAPAGDDQERPARQERHRRQARDLLQQQELGRMPVRRTAGERHAARRHGGHARRQPRAARLHPRGARRRRVRAADRHRPGPGHRRGHQDQLREARHRRVEHPVARRAPALRDEGQVHPGDRDRLALPAPRAPPLLREGELHPDLDERRADARLPAVHPAAGGRPESCRCWSSPTAIRTATATSTAR